MANLNTDLLSPEQAIEATVAAYNSKSAIEKINGLQSSASEIDGVINISDSKLVKIQKLFKEACVGKKSDVKYIVVGDSTRDNSTNEMQSYYAQQLTKIGVLHYDNSESGQSGHDWAYNVDQSTLAQCITACTGTDGENTIIEFSHGINDYSLNPVKATIKADLIYGLNQLKIAKPKVNILLVSPVTTGNTARNPILLEIYTELSSELNLPLVDVTTMTASIQSDVNFYQDATHPNKFGSRRIVDYVFSKIIPLELISIMTIEPYYNGVQSPSAILSTDAEVNYWNTGDGVSVTSATWRRFPEIPVEPNFTLMIKHGGNRNDIIFMDKNKNWISTVSITPIDGYRTRLIPSNAFFVRLNISNNGATYDALNDVREVKYYDSSQGLYLTIEDIHSGLNIRNAINRFKNGILVDDYGMIGSSGQNLTVDTNGKMKWV